MAAGAPSVGNKAARRFLQLEQGPPGRSVRNREAAGLVPEWPLSRPSGHVRHDAGLRQAGDRLLVPEVMAATRRHSRGSAPHYGRLVRLGLWFRVELYPSPTHDERETREVSTLRPYGPHSFRARRPKPAGRTRLVLARLTRPAVPVSRLAVLDRCRRVANGNADGTGSR
jgi:hypothetical protein